MLLTRVALLWNGCICSLDRLSSGGVGWLRDYLLDRICVLWIGKGEDCFFVAAIFCFVVTLRDGIRFSLGMRVRSNDSEDYGWFSSWSVGSTAMHA